MSSSTQRRMARCPACGKRRNVETQRGLRAVEKQWVARMERWGPVPDDSMRALAVAERSNWFWACDLCIRSGEAVPAKIERHTIGMGTSFAASVDRPFRCGDCGADAVFSAKEQQHWFEQLRFLIWVYPKQCAPCRAERRRIKRTHAALAEVLGGLDPKDAEQLERVADLYERLRLQTRADEFRARAKNRRRRDGSS